MLLRCRIDLGRREYPSAAQRAARMRRRLAAYLAEGDDAAALRAAPSLLDGFLLADGDLVCDAEVFDRVARFPGSCAAVARPSPLAASSEDAEAVRCLTNARHQITKIGKAIGPGSVGECVGLYGVSGAAVAGARLPFFLDASEASEYYEDSFDRALRAGGGYVLNAERTARALPLSSGAFVYSAGVRPGTPGVLYQVWRPFNPRSKGGVG